jgi:hypothetical protein
MLDLAIKNVHMVTPDGVVYGGLGVEGETISYIGPAKELPGAKRVVDGQDPLANPGFMRNQQLNFKVVLLKLINIIDKLYLKFRWMFLGTFHDLSLG